MLPAENGLRIIAPYMTFFNTLFNRSLHYDVIGGWLPSFLEDRKKLANCLKSYTGVYVETQNMKGLLKELGFENVYVIPNCKKIDIIDKAEIHPLSNNVIKFATFSRVMKAKGIEDAAKSIREANSLCNDKQLQLVVYGMIEDGEAEWFNSLKEEYAVEMHYGGMIPFNQSTEVLKQYYGLLFPTYYSGEGFAGTPIDAYAAGLPVIASDWKYNTEIVIDGEDGIIVPIRDTKRLAKAILWSVEHQTEWLKYRFNVIMKAKAFLPSNALVELKNKLK